MPEIISYAHATLTTQIDGVAKVQDVLNENFERIALLLAKCRGHIITSGVGKSGIIAKKISSTMSSIGVPSFFLDPFNAGHGDLGVITSEDVVLMISNSGESEDLLVIVNYVKSIGVASISITRNSESSLASATDFTITLPLSLEAHTFGAPTTSTTQTLVLGDILAVCTSKIKNFQKIDYAKLHPSGNLGMKITKIAEIMDTNIPYVEVGSNIYNAIEVMTKNSNGFVCVVENEKLCGIITDGDIRRFLLKRDVDIQKSTPEDLCNKNPKFLAHDKYVIDAFDIMSKNRIGCVIVVDESHKPIGFVSRTKFGISY